MGKKKRISKLRGAAYISGPATTLSRQNFNKKDRNNLYKFAAKHLDTETLEEFGNFLDSKVSRPIELAASSSEGSSGTKTKTINVGRLKKETTYIGNTLLGSSGSERDMPNPDTIDINIYELMRINPQISAGLALVKMPLLSLSWTTDSVDKDVAKTVEYCLKPIWRSLLRSMLTAVDFGFASHEKVWQVLPNVKITSSEGKKVVTHFSGPLMTLLKVKPHHPSTVKFVFDKFDNLIGMKQTAGEEVEIDLDKMFVFTHEEEFGNPFGRSRLKQAYKVWYWQELAYQFMLQYLERRGSPPVKVEFPPGQMNTPNGVKDNSEVALDLGAAIVSNATVALPYVSSEDSKGQNMWKLEYLMDDRRGDMFIEFLQHLDNKCLRAVWVPERTLTQDTSTGSYGMASVHADLFLLTEKGLIADIEDCINKGIVQQLIQLNFPPEKQVPCYVKIDQIDWNRKALLKEIFVKMLENFDTFVQEGLVPIVSPNLEGIANFLDIPVKPWEEVVLARSDKNYEGSDVKNKGNGKEKVVKKAKVKGKESNKAENLGKGI